MLVILSILAFGFSSAFSSPAVSSVRLLSVNYMKEKGVTFKFKVDGNFKKSDLRGSVLVAGKTLRLYCNYGGDPAPATVTCTSYKGTAKYAGSAGVVSLVGRSFYFTVPARTTNAR
jgi:hypothetical protein